MGGNAIKNAVRVDASTYKTASNHVCNMIGCAGYHTSIIQAYREKDSFGDIDIIVPSSMFKDLSPIEIANIVGGQFAPFTKNGPVLSVGLAMSDTDYLQVDLISTPEDEWSFALNYFSWNDIGNLIGRIAHKMGLKFGHNGLWMPLRDGSNLFHEICVTKNFSEALVFLDYDPARYAQGFNNLEEIYQYVTTSKYFNPDIYLLDNRNHTARVRDRKRPVYMQFLKWLDDKKTGMYEFSKNKADYYPEIFTVFPDSWVDYNDAMTEHVVVKGNKKKYNGDIVSKLLKIKGKDLGVWMSKAKNFYPFSDKWAIFNMSAEEVIDEIHRVNDLLKVVK